MIFKYPKGEPFRLVFLTSELLQTIQFQKIPLFNLYEIHAYHDKLTFHEVAAFIALQREAAKLFGVEPETNEVWFPQDYNGKMVEQAFNEIDSKSLQEFLRRGSNFKSMSVGKTILVVVDPKPEASTQSWEALKAKNISLAVLQTIYEQVGYLNVHFGRALKGSLGILTMTNVYRFVHLQNQ